jgi:hypothetical protein
MWKPALKTDWCKMCQNWRFETRVKFFLQFFETLPRSSKDENNFLKKSNQAFQNILLPRLDNFQKI